MDEEEDQVEARRGEAERRPHMQSLSERWQGRWNEFNADASAKERKERGNKQKLMRRRQAPRCTATSRTSSARSATSEWCLPSLRSSAFSPSEREARKDAPSSLPLAYNSPSGEYATQCTGPWCPFPTSSSRPDSASCTRTHSSAVEPVTKVERVMGCREAEEGA